MRSKLPMRTAKIGYIVISALLCALGILLILFPKFSSAALGIICGILLILFGIIKLIGYFSKDLYRLAFQYDLTFGILMIILGTVMLTHPGTLMNFICITLGLSILADSLFKAQIAFDSKKFGISRWWVILLSAVIAGIFGAVLLFRPGDGGRMLSIFAGIAILAEGILNFSTIITAVKIIDHQMPDIISSNYFEERED
ncbi:MAG: hypothetical protein HFE30_00055 [Clostridiales bacterium]|nr:hypothetical protein [Clostridiales bacterium]